MELLGSDLYVPMKIKELAMFMQVPKADKQAFHEVIDALVKDGSVTVSGKGKLELPEASIKGVFEAHAGGTSAAASLQDHGADIHAVFVDD